MKRWYAIAGGVLLALACVLVGVMLYIEANPAETAETRVQAAVLERVAAARAPAASSAPGTSPNPEETPPPYESPVDFEALWEMNPDIYAWLYIAGTNINYPILQRDGDDKFYLSHNSEGRSNELGAVFTEQTFTRKDFTDPVTVIYGHHNRAGKMFGSLQTTYSAQGGLEEHQEIIVFLPEEELHYRVFAAVPHNMRHILYYNDFSDPEVYEAFLEQALSVRSINARVDESAKATAGDQMLILSTCLRGNSKQRYLVLAKRMDDGTAP